MENVVLRKELVEFFHSEEFLPNGKYYIGPVGNGMYQIGEECYTGEEGYKIFNEAFKNFKPEDLDGERAKNNSQ